MPDAAVFTHTWHSADAVSSALGCFLAAGSRAAFGALYPVARAVAGVDGAVVAPAFVAALISARVAPSLRWHASLDAKEGGVNDDKGSFESQHIDRLRDCAAEGWLCNVLRGRVTLFSLKMRERFKTSAIPPFLWLLTKLLMGLSLQPESPLALCYCD